MPPMLKAPSRVPRLTHIWLGGAPGHQPSDAPLFSTRRTRASHALLKPAPGVRSGSAIILTSASPFRARSSSSNPVTSALCEEGHYHRRSRL